MGCPEVEEEREKELIRLLENNISIFLFQERKQFYLMKMMKKL